MSLSRQQWTLLGIFALFIGPVLLVILMRSSLWEYRPASLKNQGHLLQPPVSIQLQRTDGMESKWLVLYVLEPGCDQKCIDNVTQLRQVHRAAGRHGEHLAIVLLSGVPADPVLQKKLAAIYPGFHFLTDPDNQAQMTLAAINSQLPPVQGALNSIRTYILDPMHNVILAYEVDADPGDLHTDLKRLLKWSDQERR